MIILLFLDPADLIITISDLQASSTFLITSRVDDVREDIEMCVICVAVVIISEYVFMQDVMQRKHR